MHIIINMSIIRTCKFILPQKHFLNYSFQGHTTNHMVYVGQVRIITRVLIQKQEMAHMKYIAHLVHLLRATIFWTNPGYQVCQHMKNLSINPFKISHTGLCQVPLTTGTFYNYEMKQHPVKKLTKTSSCTRHNQKEHVCIGTNI